MTIQPQHLTLQQLATLLEQHLPGVQRTHVFGVMPRGVTVHMQSGQQFVVTHR